jgi:hypothetical protein
MRSEKAVQTALSLSKYTSYLHTKYPPKEAFKGAEEYYDPETGSCGFHARFTKEALGVEDKGDIQRVELKSIESLLNALDAGDVLEFLHGYPSDAKYSSIPKDNRYGFHIFVLVKGGSKYYMSQGYLHRYKHSLRAYTRNQIRDMFEKIITDHCDYTNTKRWKDIDLSLHKKYFHTDLTIFPDKPVDPERKVNQIQLFVQRTQQLKT